ncbi:MAG: leucine-rich repeat domain-containing protein, partial [Coriobacteriales bacterium]|nr:leucine-rich repeat domain-containing protein [Coriobacteriales bacterium]
IGSFAFAGTAVQDVEFTGSIVAINDHAFYHCTSLSQVRLPEFLTSIQNNAFEGCSGLQQVEIPGGVTTIGAAAFKNCSFLETVIIPADEHLGSINAEAFYGCSSLKNFTFARNLTDIGSSAFAGCSDLAGISFQSATPPTIASNAFSGVTATALYNGNLTAWTSSDVITKGFGGNLTWKASSGNNFGWCGDNAIWSFDLNTRVLRITGSGPMYEYGSADQTPWTNLMDDFRTLEVSGVNYIGDHAFEDAAILEDIVWNDDAVLYIGDYAFADCISIESFELPPAVIGIGTHAFDGDYNMYALDFPETLGIIGDYAFAYCSNMDEQYFHGDAPQIGQDAFKNVGAFMWYPLNYNGWTTDVMQQYGGALTWKPYEDTRSGICGYGEGGAVLRWELNTATGELVFTGSGVMEDYTGNALAPWYEYADKVSSVQLAKDQENIGNLAFANCVNLQHVAVPDGCQVKSVGMSAFVNCNSLTGIDIPASVTTVSTNAFRNCSSLENVAFLGGSVDYIAFDAFTGVTATVTYPQGGACWTDEMFQDYGGDLTWVATGAVDSGQCGDDLYWSFDESSGTLTIMGDGDMWDFVSVSAHPWSVFDADIVAVLIDDGCTHVGTYAFAGTTVEEVEMPASVTSLGESAFHNAVYLEVVELSPAIQAISEYAFYGCSSLTSITLPQELAAIDGNAFALSGLESVTIPDGVSGIGGLAFANCYDLTDITFAGSAPGMIASSAFANVVANVHYPISDTSWTSANKLDYGGELTWDDAGPWVLSGVNAPATAYVGDAVGFNAILTGNTNGLEFNYAWSWEGQWGDNWSSTLKETGDYTSDTSSVFTPTKEGTYYLWIDVTDGVRTETATQVPVVVSKKPKVWTLNGVNAPSTAYIGDTVTFSADIGNDPGYLMFSYAWSYEGGW